MLAFYEAIINKNEEKAMSFLSKKEFTRFRQRTQQMVDMRKETVSNQIANIHGYGVKDPKQWQFKLIKKNAIEWTVLKRNPTNETWDNDYIDGNWMRGPINFVKENGVWKISHLVF